MTIFGYDYTNDLLWGATVGVNCQQNLKSPQRWGSGHAYGGYHSYAKTGLSLVRKSWAVENDGEHSTSLRSHLSPGCE